MRVADYNKITLAQAALALPPGAQARSGTLWQSGLEGGGSPVVASGLAPTGGVMAGSDGFTDEVELAAIVHIAGV